VILPPNQLTRSQLEARERIHLEMAIIYENRSDESMARKFRELASMYRTELDARPIPPETPQEAEIRERRAAARELLIERGVG
jgi:hypothetical protein